MKKLLVLLVLASLTAVGCTRKSCPAYEGSVKTTQK